MGRTKLVKLSETEYKKLVDAKELLKRRGTDYLAFKTSIPIDIQNLDLGEIVGIGSEIIIHFLEEP